MEQLPPGFRFYPTEEELLTFYLHNKIHNQKPELDRVIPSIDIYNYDPSQLPGLAGELCQGDTEQWFFFMPQQEREARGGRPNRTTASGYWKATGSPTYVYSSHTNKVIGVKKTLVFYKGKAPTGRKTKWKMNEYKACTKHPDFSPAQASSSSVTVSELIHGLSLCRVYITSGCARAFDRRPSQEMVPGNFDVQANGAGACPQSANTTSMFMDKSSSTDSSNSKCDDQGTGAQQAAVDSGNTFEVETAEDVSLWDLKDLGWL